MTTTDDPTKDAPLPTNTLTRAAIALYDHWRRNSPKIGDWNTATTALQGVFLEQATALATAELLTGTAGEPATS